jgi:hypothetical protein
LIKKAHELDVFASKACHAACPSPGSVVPAAEYCVEHSDLNRKRYITVVCANLLSKATEPSAVAPAGKQRITNGCKGSRNLLLRHFLWLEVPLRSCVSFSCVTALLSYVWCT